MLLAGMDFFAVDARSPAWFEFPCLGFLLAAGNRVAVVAAIALMLTGASGTTLPIVKLPAKPLWKGVPISFIRSTSGGDIFNFGEMSSQIQLAMNLVPR